MVIKSRLCGALLFNALLLIGTSYLHASESPLPEPFQGDDPRSKLSIAYADLDAFIKPHFFQSGPSTRAKAPESSGNIGTRFKIKVNRYTALEGNRFYFKNLQNPEIVAVLSDLVESLEMLPDQIPLSILNRNEQLAYWLNLYNFALLEELSQVYPKTSLENVLDYVDDNSILAKKVLKVSGVSLSLNNIQYDIVYKIFPEKHNILYGFFQGNIGGPNIREKAYEGDTVWRALEENGKRFVNSNRGAAVGSSGKVRVSELYEYNMMLFNNDKEVLRNHLQDLAVGDLETALATMKSAIKIDFDIVDWNFADLFGDPRSFGGGSHTNAAALLDSVKATMVADGGRSVQSYLSDDLQSKAKMDIRFSDSELETLLMLKQKRNESMGTVEIRDIE
ncbi:DUF547 domain-containing protein [Brumicola nitratireducens]|uniref:DUF547 domain-containing protein n=1 Tax=Glaciecola nitratireducens (strain JCM 12485 / KCTC 12276 / FR1064) TaxID=1085623 RepID=G4QFY2_GLANF|nr:DUF547 domain-containing protein [Glaciecola nitratireducens]AEP29073.1 hypothetical protein GNIT_0935 [Glaciecola nitratireducens FR1064]